MDSAHDFELLYRRYFEEIRPSLAKIADAVYGINISDDTFEAFWESIHGRNRIKHLHRGIITAEELVNVIPCHLQDWIEHRFEVIECTTAEQLKQGEPHLQEIANILHSFVARHRLATSDEGAGFCSGHEGENNEREQVTPRKPDEPDRPDRPAIG